MEAMIAAYLADHREKIPLGQVVDCFKGKAVSRKAEAGEFGLINLSDMGQLGLTIIRLEPFIWIDDNYCAIS